MIDDPSETPQRLAWLTFFQLTGGPLFQGKQKNQRVTKQGLKAEVLFFTFCSSILNPGSQFLIPGAFFKVIGAGKMIANYVNNSGDLIKTL